MPPGHPQRSSRRRRSHPHPQPSNFEAATTSAKPTAPFKSPPRRPTVLQPSEQPTNSRARTTAPGPSAIRSSSLGSWSCCCCHISRESPPPTHTHAPHVITHTPPLLCVVAPHEPSLRASSESEPPSAEPPPPLKLEPPQRRCLCYRPLNLNRRPISCISLKHHPLWQCAMPRAHSSTVLAAAPQGRQLVSSRPPHCCIIRHRRRDSLSKPHLSICSIHLLSVATFAPRPQQPSHLPTAHIILLLCGHFMCFIPATAAQ